MSQGLRAPFVGLALGGVVVGHVVGYAIAFPVAAVRDRHLTATGHAGFPDLAAVAAVAAALGLLAVAASALRRRSAPPLRVAAARLIAVQVPVFLALELIERHLSVSATLSDPGVTLGIVAQLAVALAIALLVHGVDGVARAVLGRRPTRPRAGSSSIEPAPVARPVRRRLGGGRVGLRAPPAPSVC